MKTKQEILNILRKLKQDLFQKFKIREIWAFGSVMREEQHENSDIDILVDFNDEADLFDLIGLGLFLEDKLGAKVDVVTKRSLRNEIRENVLKEIVPV